MPFSPSYLSKLLLFLGFFATDQEESMPLPVCDVFVFLIQLIQSQHYYCLFLASLSALNSLHLLVVFIQFASQPHLDPLVSSLWCYKPVWAHGKVKPKKGQPCLASAQAHLAHSKVDLSQCQARVASCQACLALGKVRVGSTQASLGHTQIKVPHAQKWRPLKFLKSFRGYLQSQILTRV